MLELLEIHIHADPRQGKNTEEIESMMWGNRYGNELRWKVKVIQFYTYSIFVDIEEVTDHEDLGLYKKFYTYSMFVGIEDYRQEDLYNKQLEFRELWVSGKV